MTAEPVTYVLRFSNSSCTNYTNPKTEMNPLIKKVLDKDIRTLIKAGYLDCNLNLTVEGKQEVWALLYDKFKKELVEAASEKLKEEKEDKS